MYKGEIMMDFLQTVIVGGLAGIIAGLIPYFIGKNKDQIKMATQALIVCGICGIFLGLLLALPVALIYTFLICSKYKNEITCPYCKERILKDATICKYCKQNINQ